MSLLGKINSNDTSKMLGIAKLPEIQVKITIVGESSVGKTSLSQRIAYDKFTVDTETTIGAAFCQFRHISDNIIYSFKLWDTAGQERFNSLVPMYLNGSHIILMVFDITSTDSFEKIKERWFSKVKDMVPNGKIILIGNKSDLKEKRQVNYYAVDKFIKQHDMLYLECSAKNSQNLNEIANFLLDSAREIKKEKLGDTVILDTVEPVKAGCLQCYIF